MQHSIDINRKGTTTYYTKNTRDTKELADRIGKQLLPNTIITLSGDLGSGKTAFVQGLAKGLGVPDDYYVTSPTYNIVNDYPGRLKLYHLDLYRIGDPDELYDIGLDDMIADQAVMAVEWPDRLPDKDFDRHIDIRIEITAEESRSITIEII